ncbi:regulator of nonsense transcripts 3B-like isoform X2 [Artemia franciscana]|nr:hypothetical protein QYM36_005373 [Artemia franciscana]
MKEEEFLEQIQPIPPNDYFVYFEPFDTMVQPSYSRAYFNFINTQDVYIFRDKFDGYVFVDAKGNEYPAIVEFAPYQKTPKGKKKDDKVNTIENEPEYIKFLETLENPEAFVLPNAQVILEELEERNKEKKGLVHTPLVDYLNKRIEERARIRDERREERRKRELERKQKREDDRSKRVAAIEKGKKTSREQEKWDEWEDDYEESAYYSKRKEPSWKEKKTFKEEAKKVETKSLKEKKVIEEASKIREGKEETTLLKKKESDDKIPKKEEEKSKSFRSESKIEKPSRDKKPERKLSKGQKEVGETDLETTDRKSVVRPEKWPEKKIKDETELKMKAEKQKREAKEFLDKEKKEIKAKASEVSQPTSIKVGDKREVETEDVRKVTEALLEMKSEEREGLVTEIAEKEKRDAKTERRVRNKDRPSLEIYRPGMRRKGAEQKEDSPRAEAEPDQSRISPVSQEDLNSELESKSKDGKHKSDKGKGEVRTRTFRRSNPRD